jgi:hypothetical protein
MNVLVNVFLLLIANFSNIAMDNHMSVFYKSADLALNDIKDAEYNGADVSILIEKFNAALGLMEQANTNKHTTCFSYNSCLDSAVTILNSIINDSAFLKDEAIRISGYRNVTLMGIYLPSIAFFSLLFVFYLYNTWKSFQRDRFLNMHIKERRDK